MRYFGRIQHREFSDLAVVIGPNVRWVQDDYEDLQEFAPEVLLGYRVLLTTPDDVRIRSTAGLRIEKIVVLDGISRSRMWQRALVELESRLVASEFPKIEWYHVHRSENPVVRRIG